MSRELTLTADYLHHRVDPDLRAEVQAWLEAEGLWGEPKITHLHFYEGRVEARCLVGDNPSWSGSPHSSPWLFQNAVFPVKTPPPARLIRQLMSDDKAESDG
jgi:hypothetical protein